MASPVTTVKENLSRFHEFREKFDRRLQQELESESESNGSVSSTTPEVATASNTSDGAEVEETASAADSVIQSSMPTTNQQMPAPDDAQSSSNPQGQVTLPVEANIQQQRLQFNLTDPKEQARAHNWAIKFIDDFWKEFFTSPQNQFKYYHNLEEEIHSKFEAKRLEVVQILMSTTNDDAALERALRSFKKVYEWKLEKAEAEVMQRNGVATIVKDMFQIRYGHLEEQFDESWIEKCKTSWDVEKNYLYAEDALDLAIIMNDFGDAWAGSYYRKLKRDKAQELFRAVVFVQTYLKRLETFLNTEMCVDDQVFKSAEAEARAAAGAPLSDLLNKKVNEMIKGMKAKVGKQLELNLKNDRRCFKKSLAHACTKYKELMAKSVQNAGSDEDLHRITYDKIRKCFETVPDFKRTRFWKWPKHEPRSIRKYFKEAQVQRLKLTIAAQLGKLKQLEPEELPEPVLKDMLDIINAVGSKKDSSASPDVALKRRQKKTTRNAEKRARLELVPPPNPTDKPSATPVVSPATPKPPAATPTPSRFLKLPKVTSPCPCPTHVGNLASSTPPPAPPTPLITLSPPPEETSTPSTSNDPPPPKLNPEVSSASSMSSDLPIKKQPLRFVSPDQFPVPSSVPAPAALQKQSPMAIKTTKKPVAAPDSATSPKNVARRSKLPPLTPRPPTPLETAVGWKVPFVRFPAPKTVLLGDQNPVESSSPTSSPTAPEHFAGAAPSVTKPAATNPDPTVFGSNIGRPKRQCGPPPAYDF